jgi:hypothetical protein
MIRRIPNTWAQRVATTQAIMSAAWRLLKLQKQLLLLPIASSACLLLLTASWAIPAFFGMFSGPSWQDSVRLGDTSSSIGAFLFYVITYGVVIFFNAALASCVLRNLEGKPVSILTGLHDAATLLPQILGWALLSATIGMILKTIERRSGFIGGIVTKMLGFTWTLVTFLVVPILVAEHVGPVDAVRKSAQTLRQRWGEDLLAGMGFGALYFLWAIPGMVAFLLGASMIPSHLVLAITIIVPAILYFPLLGLVLSTLSTIFDVVLYSYAKLGTITPGFDRDLLESSFIRKSPE